MICKHSIRIETCALCNGYQDQIDKKKREREIERELNMIQDSKSKSDLTNHGEDWSENECGVLFREFEGGNISLNSKEGKRKVRELANLLERTRKSIVWHYKQMFTLEGLDAHAGETMLQFKRQYDLEGDITD